jgi:hypothetical protein
LFLNDSKFIEASGTRGFIILKGESQRSLGEKPQAPHPHHRILVRAPFPGHRFLIHALCVCVCVYADEKISCPRK